ncbi:MAG: hypothetical protein V3W45_07730, partial [Sedimentisphaerales bacterium]
AYVTLHILASLFSEKIKIKPNNIIFVTGTAVASLVLMTVIINPFKFESPVWNVQQFLGLHRIWRPKYELKNPLGYTHLFSVIYIVNMASIIIWLMVRPLWEVFRRLPDRIDEELQADTYQLPKIDLVLLVVAALTVYMAYRSRRFIPVAAIAACPVIAMFIDQMTRTVSASRNFHKQNHLTVSPMPYNLQIFFTVAAGVAVLTFGTWWGLKFKRVYLDPWPNDPKLNSVFMRMTASDAKPFWACQFIKDNKLQGKMFNYWTEGGFVAYGQQPDPNTGKTPLQLFMDGRAQAAYEPEAYKLWGTILEGGEIVQRARIRKTTPDYTKVGQWIAQELKRRNVWIVLMPRLVFSKPIVRGLEHNGDWALVFFNNKQKLFANIKTPQGQKLFEDVLNGKAVYPDEFSKNLVIAHNMYRFGKGKAEKQQGLDFAVKAFESHPSLYPMQEIVFASRFPELRARVYNFLRNYFDDFTKNKDVYIKQDGHHHRFITASLAGYHLQKIAESQKDSKLAQFYSAKKKEYDTEMNHQAQTKRW